MVRSFQYCLGLLIGGVAFALCSCPCVGACPVLKLAETRCNCWVWDFDVKLYSFLYRRVRAAWLENVVDVRRQAKGADGDEFSRATAVVKLLLLFHYLDGLF
jgi:hypothetical protein